MEIIKLYPTKYASLFAFMYGDIGRIVAEKWMDVTLDILEELASIGKKAADERHKHEAISAVMNLGVIGKIAINKSFQSAAIKAMTDLEVIGRLTLEKTLISETPMVIYIIRDIGKVAGKEHLIESLRQSIASLEILGELTKKEKRFKEVHFDAMKALHSIKEVVEDKEPLSSELEKIDKAIKSIAISP